VRIDKHESRLANETVSINATKKAISRLKKGAIDFNNNRVCNKCSRVLELPTVLFLCQHVFCESCVDVDVTDTGGILRCPIDNPGKYFLSFG
jgi:hypothetical protein